MIGNSSRMTTTQLRQTRGGVCVKEIAKEENSDDKFGGKQET